VGKQYDDGIAYVCVWNGGAMIAGQEVKTPEELMAKYDEIMSKAAL
jgi:hypothetical protein